MAPKRQHGKRNGGVKTDDANTGHQHSPFDEPHPAVVTAKLIRGETPGSAPSQAADQQHVPVQGNAASDVSPASTPQESTHVSVPVATLDISDRATSVKSTDPAIVSVDLPPSTSEFAIESPRGPQSSAVDESEPALRESSVLMTPPAAAKPTPASPGASAITPCSTLPATPDGELAADNVVAAAASPAKQTPLTVKAPSQPYLDTAWLLLIEAAVIARAIAIVAVVYTGAYLVIAWAIVKARYPSYASAIEKRATVLYSKVVNVVTTRVVPLAKPRVEAAVQHLQRIDQSRLSGQGEAQLRAAIDAIRREWSLVVATH